jgi:hypothetical protein
MSYEVKSYTCPICHQKMEHDGDSFHEDIGIYSCRKCATMYFESTEDSGHFYYKARSIYSGTFSQCCKALKLKAFL